MDVEVPNGFWLKEELDEYYCIGFQHGGHAGGECELFLPKEDIDRLLNDTAWRKDVVLRFSRTLYIGNPNNPMEMSTERMKRDGFVLKNWEIPPSYKMPKGYWVVAENNTSTHLCVATRKKADAGWINKNLFLPEQKLEKFYEDEEWRDEIMNEFAKVYYTGRSESPPEIAEELVNRTGYIADSEN